MDQGLLPSLLRSNNSVQRLTSAVDMLEAQECLATLKADKCRVCGFGNRETVLVLCENSQRCGFAHVCDLQEVLKHQHCLLILFCVRHMLSVPLRLCLWSQVLLVFWLQIVPYITSDVVLLLGCVESLQACCANTARVVKRPLQVRQRLPH